MLKNAHNRVLIITIPKLRTMYCLSIKNPSIVVKNGIDEYFIIFSAPIFCAKSHFSWFSIERFVRYPYHQLIFFGGFVGFPFLGHL